MLCAISFILMLINVITVLKYYEYAGYSGLYVSLSKVYKIFTALPIIILFLYITNVLKTNSKVIKITIFALTAGETGLGSFENAIR